MEKNSFNFKKEITSVWSFPIRGNWETHNSKYRGNFAPQIPRNLILKYSKRGDTVLDPMMGGGTTLIEAKMLNRKGIGFDINPDAVKLCKKNLSIKKKCIYEPNIRVADARNFPNIEDESIDLVIIHPPYMNIIKYSSGKINADLSNYKDLNKFIFEFEKVIAESYRVLKDNHFFALLIGDTRKKGHYVPISYYVLNACLKKGFILKEEIIKIQHNCSSTSYWRKQVEKYNFYLIMHEHLFIFRKPYKNENLEGLKYSCIDPE
ncbi:MAG: TRM11 family SAM-dependent methyltransferase [bacterium]